MKVLEGMVKRKNENKKVGNEVPQSRGCHPYSGMCCEDKTPAMKCPNHSSYPEHTLSFIHPSWTQVT